MKKLLLMSFTTLMIGTAVQASTATKIIASLTKAAEAAPSKIQIITEAEASNSYKILKGKPFYMIPKKSDYSLALKNSADEYYFVSKLTPNHMYYSQVGEGLVIKRLKVLGEKLPEGAQGNELSKKIKSIFDDNGITGPIGSDGNFAATAADVFARIKAVNVVREEVYLTKDQISQMDISTVSEIFDSLSN